ncbi:MAG: DNA translocase FtsK [Phycisphaerales bacterium]|nr:DNA translocase FtsK [Phycisphaerales bacterium]
MARRKKRQGPRPLFGPIFLTLGCLFIWAAMLTFDAADPPNPSHFPHNSPAENACGRAGALVSYFFFYWLGDGAYPLLVFGTLAAGMWLVHGKIERIFQRTFGLIVLVICTSVSVQLVSPGGDNSLAIGDGGVLGAGVGAFLMHVFAGWGTVLVLIYSFIVGLLFTAEGWVLRLPGAVQKVREVSGDAMALARSAVASAIPTPVTAGAPAAVVEDDDYEEVEVKTKTKEPKINSSRSKPKKQPKKAKEEDTLFEKEPEPTPPAPKKSPAEKPATEPVDVEDVVEQAPEKRPEPKVNVSRPKPIEPPPEAYPKPIGTWSFPPLDLLHEAESNFTAQQETAVRAKARLLEQTLEEFRLDAHVVEIDTGPVITMFELQLGAGIKVSQISSLANDVARALKAPAVRVVAPIPGKNTVGIEVPNTDKEKVRLRELIELSAQKARKMALPIFFGKDASGAVLLADLAGMPHMLIAGTTGSGKSVCINSVIASLLMTKKPDEVKLILVDPKMVEMSQFKDVPHLMSPIITDMNRAEQILDWAVTKMEERYELLAEARVRNIASFNKLGEEEIYRRFQPSNDLEKAQIPKVLPYIVVIIDELADLMMTAAKEVEHHLARLAQKSRAVGIHIVVATQRPEAKVVTGLIKSNMPCRAAFRVASRMDSRIVLDQNGAEVLMGQGDMLFLPPGSHKLIRSQGTLLEDDELHRIIDHLTDQAQPEFHPQLMRIKPKGLEGGGPRDPLFDDAVKIVLETKRGSVSLLQRRLSVGYSRASRLIDEMAEAGVVGEFKGSQAREVVMTLDEWESLKAHVDREVAEGGYAADQEDFDASPTATATVDEPARESKSGGTSVADKYDDPDDASYEDDDDDDEYDEDEDDDEEEDEDDEEEDDDDSDDEELDEDDELADDEGEEEDDGEYEEDDDEEYEEDEEWDDGEESDDEEGDDEQSDEEDEEEEEVDDRLL